MCVNMSSTTYWIKLFELIISVTRYLRVRVSTGSLIGLFSHTVEGHCTLHDTATARIALIYTLISPTSKLTAINLNNPHKLQAC